MQTFRKGCVDCGRNDFLVRDLDGTCRRVNTYSCNSIEQEPNLNSKLNMAL